MKANLRLHRNRFTEQVKSFHPYSFSQPNLTICQLCWKKIHTYTYNTFYLMWLWKWFRSLRYKYQKYDYQMYLSFVYGDLAMFFFALFCIPFENNIFADGNNLFEFIHIRGLSSFRLIPISIFYEDFINFFFFFSILLCCCCCCSWCVRFIKSTHFIYWRTNTLIIIWRSFSIYTNTISKAICSSYCCLFFIS